jgi:DNA-binding transcriptional regulator LsrR (DeoR family)
MLMDFTEQDLLAQVASLYYEEELTQATIAQRLGLSRVKVYRLLKQARADQVIQFTINWPLRRNEDLELELCRRFGLRQALILRGDAGDRAHNLQRMGQLGARFLERHLRDGMTMAVCLGRSTYEVIHAIRPGFQVRVDVAQAMGAVGTGVDDQDSASLSRALANKLGGTVYYLSAPFMADTPHSAQVLRSQRDIQRTLNKAASADVALVGIGALDSANSEWLRSGWLTAADLESLKRRGAVGDMGGQILTQRGQLHAGELSSRVIGITLADLKEIPTVVAVARGPEKTAAILSALRSSAINIFCSDDDTAGALLALAESQPSWQEAVNP